MTPDQECAAVLGCLPCGVYVLDGQWRFTFINPRAAQLLEQLSQKPCEQLIGKTIWEECREAADSVAAGEFRRAITEKRTVEFEAFYPALGRWFAFHACPGQERLYVSFHDVSERKRLAGELSRRAEALADAERGKHELLAELAHELRNDLAPIRNALHLMVVPVEGGESVAQARELAEQQVRHAARLLDDLLKTSEIARGKIQPRKVAVDLGTVVATALECELDAIKSRGNSLTIDLPAERLALEADPDLLREMVRRLLVHAAGQTRPGCHIWVTAEAQGEDVVLVVRDDGAGLDRELLPRLFDLFLGPGQSPIHPQGVLRTGLAGGRGLAELHGGSVEAFSDGPGLGSQLVVRLPATPAMLGEGDTAARSGGGELRVLLVDDNVETARSLTLLLELWGHEVRVRYDGVSALEEARLHPPDVVLLDIGMPGMDGYQVAHRLREQEGGGVPILIALTGYGQEEARQRAREAGFEYHVVKPADPAELRELLVLAESLVRQMKRPVARQG